jgi:hypothetical protein
VLHSAVVAKGNFSLINFEGNGAIAPHRIFKKNVLIDLPVDYHKPSMTKAMGASRIHVEHKVVVKVVKDTLNTHRINVELPFILTTKETKIEEKRQVISLVSAANVVTPPTPVQRRKSKSKHHKSHREGDEPKVPRLPPLQAFPSNSVTFDTPPLNSPTREDISLLNFSTLYNPFLGPITQSPLQPQAPVYVPTFTTYGSNPFTESAAPNPFQMYANTNPNARFDSIPSTFSSTKSVSLYNPDPAIKGGGIDQNPRPGTPIPQSNPFLEEYSNPFTKTLPFDISKTDMKVAPGEFSRDEFVDIRMPESKNKGYQTL